MPTLRELAEERERSHFVGRREVLGRFRRWLEDDASEVALVNLTGHAGVGKTMLVRELARLARDAGRDVRTVDCRDLRTPEASLVEALGGRDLGHLLSEINRRHSIVLVDALPSAIAADRELLDDILPGFEPGTRAVAVTQTPLLGRYSDHPLARFVREFRLEPFTRSEAATYLERRGITDRSLVDRILRATVGNPLALSLAADVVQRSDDVEFETVADWKDALGELTARLLTEVDPAEREVIEAISIVREFDEKILEVLLGRPVAEERLRTAVGLSVVRRSKHGFRLHDDVRELVVGELRARAPQQHHELRRRALHHYRRRLATADPGERARLVNERLHLWEHDFIRHALFPAGSARDDEVAIEPAAPDELDEVVTFWAAHAQRSDPMQGVPPAFDLPESELVDLIAHPAARAVTVRARSDGRLLAVGLEARIARDSLPVLPSLMGPVVEAYFGSRPGRLPAHHAASPYRYLGPIVARPDGADLGMPALARWSIGTWIHGGTLVVGTRMPGYSALMSMLGFESLSVEGDVHGLVLDLNHDDVADWIDRITSVASAPTPDLEVATRSSEASVAVRTLGAFRVERDGQDVTPTGIAADAVKHVAVAGGRLHVDQLVDRLWPDDLDRGRTRLRNVLSRLRTTSGHVLTRRDGEIRLGDDVVVDAAVFVEEVDRARGLVDRFPSEAVEVARQALARYADDLLLGDPYARAFVAPRERLRRLRIAAHEVLAAGAAATGDLRTVVTVMEQAIDLDPYAERLYLEAARWAVEAGDHSRAVAVIRRAKTMLEELGVEPSAALAALEERVTR